MKKYDVIIIGCGPSGVSAAKVLDDSNINYCIIERSKFPREKICGGGLTHKSLTILNELGFNLDVNKKEINNVKIVSKNKETKIDLINKTTMIDRLEFDYNNLKQIKNNILKLEKVINIENNILITDKEKYEFKYIIFADGVNGYSKKLIKNRKFAFSVECNSNIITKETIFDFDCIKHGYGWIFPKNNYTNIGIGKFKGNEDYIKTLIEFSKKYSFDIDKSKIRGYFLPIFSKKIYKKSVINNKYILVGDSASLVDQVSGEGIYYALSSGKVAALSITECLNNNKNLKKVYFKKSKYIYIKLSKRKFLSKLLYSKFGNIFIKIGLKNKYLLKRLNNIFG